MNRCYWCGRIEEPDEVHGVISDDPDGDGALATCVVKMIVHYPTKCVRLDGTAND